MPQPRQLRQQRFDLNEASRLIGIAARPIRQNGIWATGFMRTTNGHSIFLSTCGAIGDGVVEGFKTFEPQVFRMFFRESV